MKAVILAGGLGSRLRPFTEVIPKPLLPVGEKSILEIQIEKLKSFDFKEIFIATNYKAEYIENFLGDGSRYGVKIFYSRETKPLGTVGPLSLLKPFLNEAFLLINGDILTLTDFSKFYNFAQQNDSLLNIAIRKEITPFAFGRITFQGDHVIDIQEKPDFINYILAGIYTLKPGIFSYIKDDEYMGMDQLIRILLENKAVVSKYEIHEYWLDIGRPGDYEKAQEVF